MGRMDECPPCETCKGVTHRIISPGMFPRRKIVNSNNGKIAYRPVGKSYFDGITNGAVDD
jgi:hypothetical protein